MVKVPKIYNFLFYTKFIFAERCANSTYEYDYEFLIKLINTMSLWYNNYLNYRAVKFM